MAIVWEGELRSVYYKGAGGRLVADVHHLASIRVIDYFDRWADGKMSHNVSRSGAAKTAEKATGSGA
jgi:hypothetical protein